MITRDVQSCDLTDPYMHWSPDSQDAYLVVTTMYDCTNVSHYQDLRLSHFMIAIYVPHTHVSKHDLRSNGL